MAGPAEADIRREVKIILEEADLSTVSERNIRELLSSKFGDAVETDAYKKLITVIFKLSVPSPRSHLACTHV
jgi:hypothetical protein